MQHAAAITALLAAATLTHAQARYEIGYEIAGQPEVERSESHAFSASARSGQPRGDGFQFIYGTFPFTRPAASLTFGLMDFSLMLNGRLDASTELLSTVRFKYTIEDIIFTSDGVGPIEVGLTLNAGQGYIRMCSGDACVGVEFLTELTVRLEDDERSGSSKATLDGTLVPIRDRTGILEDLGVTPIVQMDSFLVPINEPVTLTIEYFTSIRFPTGTQGGQAGRGGQTGFGFPIDQPVFSVPDGVRVDSAQGQIRDNRYRPCRLDLDTDGELTAFDYLVFQNLFISGDPVADFDFDGDLTLFDFLAFQNAFDAGCP